MKRIKSVMFSTRRTNNNHHVGAEGKRRVKQRLGWSNRNPRDSFIREGPRNNLNITQMMNLRKIGKPVFPLMMKKAETNRAYGELLKDCMEFGVRVNPRLANDDIAVKNPHQVAPTPKPVTSCR
ncbi:hypothetical protein WICPIJ_004378 [Wickerhamomyces pijperi]|uniref:Uncharacterized protein n=1 Tax=Wickerhamomyces pijperi TaxID=599730 RepID=A0A9P8Q5H6_WICPI|nr:hypothetical protein WICPIJ_004378 [Wickerhamomyces pijperi]